jgi:hypothetical protein
MEQRLVSLVVWLVVLAAAGLAVLVTIDAVRPVLHALHSALGA